MKDLPAGATFVFVYDHANPLIKTDEGTAVYFDGGVEVMADARGDDVVRRVRITGEWSYVD